MIIKKEQVPLIYDLLSENYLFPLQKFILDNPDKKKLKAHTPTGTGKTIAGVIFQLNEFIHNKGRIKGITVAPTNLLIIDQFEHSIIQGLIMFGFKQDTSVKCLDIRKMEECNQKNEYTVPFLKFENIQNKDIILNIAMVNGEVLSRVHTKTKGEPLFNLMERLSKTDFILVTNPDVLAYVSYFLYCPRKTKKIKIYKNQLFAWFSELDMVLDEYHIYDPYTYINIDKMIKDLKPSKLLILSATSQDTYFTDIETANLSNYQSNKLCDVSGEIELEGRWGQLDISKDDLDHQETKMFLFNSVIQCHKRAISLKNNNTIEWNGINKDPKPENLTGKTILATSAAEIGLDLPITSLYTEFWGSSWEVRGLIQRIGRAGRRGVKKAKVIIYSFDEDFIRFINQNKTISKDDFSKELYNRYVIQGRIDLKDYASFYFDKKSNHQELRSICSVRKEKFKFHFRIPQSSAVFHWGNHTFVYNYQAISSKFDLRYIGCTINPFWKRLNLEEFEVMGEKDRPEKSECYDGSIKRSQEELRKYYFEI